MIVDVAPATCRWLPAPRRRPIRPVAADGGREAAERPKRRKKCEQLREAFRVVSHVPQAMCPRRMQTDGADRDWVSIYEESERLLYLEIDYLNEATNAERFARDFDDVEWVRVPQFYREVSTPRVLTMEFLDSFKLTDIKTI